MSELSFAELFEGSEQTQQAKPGDVVKGTVVRVDNDFVWVDASLKSEAQIPAEQFKDRKSSRTLLVKSLLRLVTRLT